MGNGICSRIYEADEAGSRVGRQLSVEAVAFEAHLLLGPPLTTGIHPVLLFNVLAVIRFATESEEANVVPLPVDFDLATDAIPLLKLNTFDIKLVTVW
jgi:hypothetical protein